MDKICHMIDLEIRNRVRMVDRMVVEKVRVPSIKIPVFFAKNNHPFFLGQHSECIFICKKAHKNVLIQLLDLLKKLR